MARIALFGLFLAIGCSTTNVKGFQKSEVLERIANLDETPEWASGQKVLWEENGFVIFANRVEMSGDARPDACVRVSEETSRAAILRYVSDGITSSGQINELSASNDPGMESLTAFLASGKLSGVKIAERYWEKMVQSDSTGSPSLRIACVAKVQIQKAALEMQLKNALNPTGNAEIRKALLAAQKDFLNNLNKE